MRATTDPPIDAAEFASGLSTAKLHCRELGHMWRSLTVSMANQGAGFSRVLRCSSCRTERHEQLDRAARIMSYRYRYADGYLATRVEAGTLHRDVFRLESLTRYFEHNTGASLRSVS